MDMYLPIVVAESYTDASVTFVIDEKMILTANAVKNNEDINNPNTGDGIPVMLYSSLFATSGLLAACLYLRKRFYI